MKSFLRNCVGWLLSGILGVLGGFLYVHLHTAPKAGVTTVRSTRFELVDSRGKVLAFWGNDRGNNIVLAFVQPDSEEAPSSERLNQPRQQMRFTGQNPDEAFAVGMMSTEVPFMNIVGKDGKSRALLYLTQQQKPLLNMSDERRESRLELGSISKDAPGPEDDDWALRFRAPDVAGIGSIKDPIDHKYRGYLLVDRNPKTQ